MNIMLIGGAGHFIDSLINKLNKEGHRIYLLTGTRYKQHPYQKVFERYDFTYDAECLSDIFESTSPDVTVYMGAYDTNFDWREEEKASIRFSNSMTNILMSYAMNNKGRFVYLSSDEVFGQDYPEDITEYEKPTPATIRGLALSQGEELCRTYRESRNLDIITVRLDHYYSVPDKRADVTSIPAKMCLELLEKESVHIVPDNRFSLLYETDAVETVYRLISCQTHRHPIYHISSSAEISEREIGDILLQMNKDTAIFEKPIPGRRCVLSAGLYNAEFGKPYTCNVDGIVQKIANKMYKNSYVFLTGEDSKPPFWVRIAENSGWFVKMLIPFVENVILFIIVFLLNYFLGDLKYIQRLDMYLLYVLLFAVVYGQQQSVFAAVLASVGYCITFILNRPGHELLLDLNTYIWIAQLFIVGLVVGYLKDQIVVLRKETEEVQDFLTLQLTDMKDINTSNVRVKNALEMQLVNQNDSVGKIYRITSALDQYSPEEVLFYAADVVGQLMGTKDVAIYQISEGSFARLFSATSKKARALGNSIKYQEMGELYSTLCEHKVFINRKLDENYPLMANAVFEEGKMRVLLFVWGIPWERMTLGQSNQLTVVTSLIQEAVLRADKYLSILENQRCMEGSRVLTSEAMRTLINAYLRAEEKSLADCTVLKVLHGTKDPKEVSNNLAQKLRQTDYLGILEDGFVYILLANTNREEAGFAIERVRSFGFDSEVAEEFEI